jgi:soluble lytic murein transglycosylase-like protein
LALFLNGETRETGRGNWHPGACPGRVGAEEGPDEVATTMSNHHRDLSGWALAPIALAPLLLSLTAFTDADAMRPSAPTATAATMAEVESRTAVLSRELALAEAYYASDVEPVEGILRPFSPDAAWVRRVSLALAREGHRAGIDPRVLAAVVLVENPWLDPGIASSQGAVGLMQVMPFHAGKWGCESTDLTDPDTNVCHGARIFRSYLERSGGDIDRALLAYNGCVRGLNTPNCNLYPSHVYSSAGRAALRSWLEEH